MEAGAEEGITTDTWQSSCGEDPASSVDQTRLLGLQDSGHTGESHSCSPRSSRESCPFTWDSRNKEKQNQSPPKVQRRAPSQGSSWWVGTENVAVISQRGRRVISLALNLLLNVGPGLMVDRAWLRWQAWDLREEIQLKSIQEEQEARNRCSGHQDVHTFNLNV